MTKTAFVSTLLLFLVSSCKVIEKDLIGYYNVENVPKTTFTFNSDKTFAFIRINQNPYLHPFDHPDEFHFTTKGRWTFVSKNTIEITSQLDTVIYPLVTLQAKAPKSDSISNFKFYDIYGEQIKILYVQKNDSSIVAALHRSMDFYNGNLQNEDTLEFHFYGYPPFKFISGQKRNLDYAITLRPFFKPSAFFGRQYKIKRNKIVDVKLGVTFKKKKSGI